MCVYTFRCGVQKQALKTTLYSFITKDTSEDRLKAKRRLNVCIYKYLIEYSKLHNVVVIPLEKHVEKKPPTSHLHLNLPIC